MKATTPRSLNLKKRAAKAKVDSSKFSGSQAIHQNFIKANNIEGKIRPEVKGQIPQH